MIIMKPIYKGIILGYGKMGITHREAAQVHGAEIVAVIDPDPAARQASKLPSYASIQELAPAINVDFAVISTPTDLHASALSDVITRFPGLLGILLEKPPVRTSVELKHLRKTKFPHIFIGEVEHYNPELKLLLNLNCQPKSLTLNRQVNLEYFLNDSKPWFPQESRSGGIILDLMIHDLNLVVGKFGVPLATEGLHKESRQYDINDNVSVRLKYPGFTASLQSGWTSPDTKNPIRLDLTVTYESGHRETIECTNYLGGLIPESNPYYIQMSAFLKSLETQKLPHSLTEYLNATELALNLLNEEQKRAR